MNTNHKEAKLVTWKEVHHADYSFISPFQIELTTAGILEIDEIVRIIPGRRIVGFGKWQNKSIVAKLFLHPQHAKRQMEKDLRGISILESKNIPTPHLQVETISKDRRIYILILERLTHTQNLFDLWTEKIPNIFPILQATMIELATQHVLGILQLDLHLKNFLVSKKTIYSIDGGQIKSYPEILPKNICIPNLALFLSQLGVGYEHQQELLFKHYANARSWLLKPQDTYELFEQIRKSNSLRWKKYAKKIFRNSTDFCAKLNWHLQMAYKRSAGNLEFLNFLSNPEKTFANADIAIIKAGRSATVIKATLDDKTYIIKRYNLKNILHRARRSIRPTRAARTWELAHKLKFFGINTPDPIAFLERRFVGFRGKSYIVMDFISNIHAGEYLQSANSTDIESMIKKIVMLLKNLAKLNLSHGDLKITNILIDQNNNPCLIDLDGMKEHASLSSFTSSWDKDFARFLQNFNHQPELKNKFIAALNSHRGTP